MVTFIALLRGINVGSHSRMKMGDLRSLLAELGYTEVQTYIQSGNLVFRCSEIDESAISGAIKGKLREKYGFEVPVIVLTPVELKKIVDDNPFLELPERRLQVSFLAEAPLQVDAVKLEANDFTPEQFSLKGKAVYLYSPEDYKKKKLSNNFFEKALNVSSTTRSWRTVKRLHEIVVNR